MDQTEMHSFEYELRQEIRDTKDKLNEHILNYSVGQAKISQDLAYIKVEIKSMKDMDKEIVNIQKGQNIQLSNLSESKKGWKWISDKLVNLIIYLAGASLIWLAAQAVS